MLQPRTSSFFELIALWCHFSFANRLLQLLPGDHIWSVNGEDVKKAPRDHVIQLVRACATTVTLVVCQPPEQQGARKSTLLSASKRARLKSKPSRVRFAESVCVNGAPLFPVSTNVSDSVFRTTFGSPGRKGLGH